MEILICSLILITAMYACVAGSKTKKDETASTAGFKMWKENCSRCHNIPSPALFSDEQWDVVGAHMRVRAYLTKKESEEIIHFLKGIN